ncbi:MAG: dephospho-CoA kinase [Candidatus Cloacimonadales bacterium]
MQNKRKRATLIAITGGIASGKSVVSAWLEKEGYSVIYSDKLGHQVLQMPKIEQKLLQKFGKQILQDGKISRAKLAEVVFSDPDYLLFLNKLTHPEIRQKMQELADNSRAEILFFEIPLLYENNLAAKFDYVINVYCSAENKLARLKKRDDLEQAAAQKRIKSQLPDYIKYERADINLQNNSSRAELYRQLASIEKYLRRLPQKPIERMA